MRYRGGRREIMAGEQSVDSLVGRALGGDRGAFEELVARYRDRLLRSILNRRGGEQDCPYEPEEILNETIARAFESLESFEPRGEDSFAKWLFTISRNIEIDSTRRRKRTLL